LFVEAIGLKNQDKYTEDDKVKRQPLGHAHRSEMAVAVGVVINILNRNRLQLTTTNKVIKPTLKLLNHPDA
jgi:hypothetical protein